MDEILSRIFTWFGGYCTLDERGVAVQRYHEAGSEDDKASRRALADLLRSNDPIPESVRMRLADAIDDRHRVLSLSTRQLYFRKRDKGAPKHFIKNSQLASFIWIRRQNGHSVSSSVSILTAALDIDESTVMKIWSKMRPIFEAFPAQVDETAAQDSGSK